MSDARAEHTRRWCKYFALRGHTVDLVTVNPDVLPDYAPVRVHVLAKRWGGRNLLSRAANLPSVLRRLSGVLRDSRPEVLHAHSVGAYAWLAMLTRRCPCVVTPWGTDVLINARRIGLTRWLTRWAVRRSELAICDAHHMKRELIELGGQADKIEIVMFGTDVELFRPLPPSRVAASRAEADLGDRPVVISSRTLTPVHDVATFVQAVPEVLQAWPDALFIVAGDGPERPRLETLCADLGVADCVRFIGRYDEPQIARWLALSDVYVSTSLVDAGIAASTAEAMACELPVVATDNGENARWIKDGANGWLVPNGDFRALATRVCELLGNAQLRKSMGTRNRERIVADCNYHSEMARVERIYTQLAEHARNHLQ